MQAELSYSYWAAGQSQSTASYQEKVVSWPHFSQSACETPQEMQRHEVYAAGMQKLTAEELEEQAKREKAASSQGMSVWNEVCACPA